MSDSLHVKSGLILLATFLCGAVFGGGVHAWFSPQQQPLPPPPGLQGGPPPGALPRWMSELDLTDAQREQARAIFEKHRPELQKVFEEAFPKAREVNDKMQAELRAVLTDAQRAKLDAWWKQHPHPPGMGPGFGPRMHRGMGPGMGPRPGMGPPPGMGPLDEPQPPDAPPPP
ncbi:MAG: hypothetical protein AB1730_20805 [Myxococcota bacterium]|jgi:Spy/CpxP family protein refolding chaperone